MDKKKHTRTPKRMPKRPETPLPSDEIFRAAERAGIPPHALPAAERIAIEDRTREQITDAIAPGLVLACDQLSEEIAAIAESNGGDDANVVDALLTIWKLRWDLGLFPKPKAEAENDDNEGEQGSEAAS